MHNPTGSYVKMKKNLFFTLFFICSLWGQDLHKQENQLQNLKNKIERTKSEIKQTETKKKQVLGDLNNYKKKRNAAASKMSKLSQNGQKIKNQLSSTERELTQTQALLDKLNEYTAQEFRYLMLIHNRLSFYNQDKKQAHLFAVLVKKTISHLEELLSQKEQLAFLKKDSESEYQKVAFESEKISREKKQYDQKLGALSNQVEELEKNRRQKQKELKKMETEAENLAALVEKLRNKTKTDYDYKFSSDKLIWPVSGKVTKKFGTYKSEKYNTSLENNGIDISVEENTPVKAVDDGVIAFAEWFGGAGKLVIIDHQNGFHSLYSFNNSLLVTKGEKVKKNQNIALSGRSINDDIPLLHFELRKNGKPVNPLNFLK